MLQIKRCIAGLLAVYVIALALPAPAQTTSLLQSAAEKQSTKKAKRQAKAADAPAILWRKPTDIKTRDLFYGPGGKEHMPNGELSFIEENLNGVNPKFDVRDADGVKWGVKLGAEAGPETTATRLVWAVGYFADVAYYLPELQAKGLTLSRGQDMIDQGKIHGVRLKRHNKGEHKIGTWHEDKSPFAGTKELDGLKIMMELINNTDLKSEHWVIYGVHDDEQHYMMTDLGGSFGRAGAHFYNRSKGKLEDYTRYPLIKKVRADEVDFWRFKHIPRAHAKWIGGILAQLSDKQINDAFRAGGFSPEEARGFTRKVREKIKELNDL